MSGMSPWHAARSFTREDPTKGRNGLTPGTVRRVVSYASPYKRLIVLFLVLVIVDAFVMVATPLLLKRIVDRGVMVGNGSLVTWLAVVVAMLAVVETLLTLFQRWYSARIGEGLIYDLRAQVFDHVEAMPIAFFARSHTGSLVSRLNTDVVGAQAAFTSTMSGVVSNVVGLVLVLGAMMLLSWQITVVALLLFPLFYFPARWAGRKVSALTRRQMQVNAELGSTMTERFNVGGAMLVKLFGDPKREGDGFRDQAGQVRDLGVDIAMAGRIFFSGLTLIAALATALVYGIGGHLAIAGTVSVGTLLALAALMGRLYGPLTQLANVRVDIMTALVSFERIFEVLDLHPVIQEVERPTDLGDRPASLEFDDVTFRYPRADEVTLPSLQGAEPVVESEGGDDVLRGLSFTIEPGQMVALVGPSGAGKSTITHLVARLYDPSTGVVRIGGTDVREASFVSLRETVGYVTQDAHMFHSSIRDNLTYAVPDASDERVWQALTAARIDGLVRRLPDGLDTVVGDRGYRLSGGERQRLAIARLLLKSPRILVLDEATAHLDSESEAAVQRALDTALEGRTSLVIAHRLSTVRNADRILVIEAGRVSESGTHDELLARSGTYAMLYRTQFAEDADHSTVGA